MDKEILMKNLGITAEQAEQLMEEDKAVDKMSRVSDINGDLTADQIQASKKARSAERKRGTYNFKTSTKEKKVNEPKKELIAALVKAVGEAEDINVVNDEREFTFVKGGVKYKIVLSCPRS